MCNLFENRASFSDLLRAFRLAGRPIVRPQPQAAPNLAPIDFARPTDPAPVALAFDDGVELTAMRWGLTPGRPKSGPVINYRSEGRRFTHGRCLVPATAFFEFTGRTYPKTRWRFTVAADDPLFCFAGFWRVGEGGQGRFTLITAAAGPDMAPYHDRQPVVIANSDWADWLGGEANEGRLLAPSPRGTFTAVQDAIGPTAPSLFGSLP